MSRSFIALASTFMLSAGSFGQYSDQVRTWSEVRLQLSQEVSLGDVFASGLQPYRHPSAEDSQVYVKHAVIQLVGRDKTVFPPLPTEIMRIRVQKPHLIQRMELWSPPLTVNEARAESRKWLPLFGKSEQELDDFLSAVSKDWLHYDIVNGSSDVVQFAASRRDQDGVKVTFLLLKSWQWQAPLRLTLEVSTNAMPARKKRVYYDGPIPPPPGFEGADMKAPKDWEVDSRFTPLTAEYRAPQGTLPPKYQAMNDAAEAAAAVAGKKVVGLKEPVRNIAPTEHIKQSKSSSFWLAMVMGGVVAMGLLWWVIKGRRGRRSVEESDL